jgi:AraC-like DNA-binding protein
MNSTNKNAIPFESIEQAVASMGYDDWHSSEYFISPDGIFHPGEREWPFRPNFYGLWLCVEGWLDLHMANEHLLIQPYSLFAISPHSIIEKSIQSPDCKGRFLMFTKDFLLKNIIDVHQLESFVFFCGNATAYIQLTKKDAEPLLQLYDILKNKRDNPNSPAHTEIIRSLFFTFLYEAAALYQKNNMAARPKFTRDEDLNLKFQELLSQHDIAEHSLKFYADSLFITPKYLIHAIKNASGKTPGKLIDEAIVAEAKLLLKNHNHTIASVAEELHFSDHASFSKFFKKHTGATPLSYRAKG